MRKTALTFSLILIALTAMACGGETPEPQAPADPAPTAQTPTAQTPTAQTPPSQSSPGQGLAPITSRSSGAPTVAAPPPAAVTQSADGIVAANLAFALPEGWTSEPPSSTMRLVQVSIPGSGGNAQLTMFHFGVGRGGGVESNLARWAGQVDVDPSSTPTRDQFSSNGLTVTWIDVAGTLKPSTMGVGPTEPQPNSRLLGAVVEGPQGPWFFKATGPDSTLAEARDAFVTMLRNASPRG